MCSDPKFDEIRLEDESHVECAKTGVPGPGMKAEVATETKSTSVSFPFPGGRGDGR